MRPGRWLVLGPIAFYRRVISPGLPRHCKYEPTCSRYAADAVREFGVARGLVLGVWRVLRCNPWSHGGFDPVSAQGVFRGTRADLGGSGRRTTS
jgi:putative membrane protein insertion efficiency factor